MLRPVFPIALVLVACGPGPASAANDGFRLTAPGVDISVVPDDQRKGYRGTFRFGEGPDAFVGKGYFEIPDRAEAPDSKTKDPCPSGWTLRDGSCQRNDN